MARNWLKTAVLGAMLAVLAGCVSLGGAAPPPSLLTLTAAQQAPAGLAASGSAKEALAVLDPEAPARLDVTRVPVQVNASTLAYLKDAVWVDKPARLFARLLGETIRARQTRLVVDSADLRYAAATKLSGQLLDMGYDATKGAVVVRFDAVLQQADGTIMTKRFSAEVPGVPADAAAVGPALNEAANKVAAEVADWLG